VDQTVGDAVKLTVAKEQQQTNAIFRVLLTMMAMQRHREDIATRQEEATRRWVLSKEASTQFLELGKTVKRLTSDLDMAWGALKRLHEAGVLLDLPRTGDMRDLLSNIMAWKARLKGRPGLVSDLETVQRIVIPMLVGFEQSLGLSARQMALKLMTEQEVVGARSAPIMFWQRVLQLIREHNLVRARSLVQRLLRGGLTIDEIAAMSGVSEEHIRELAQGAR
jgi:hypothetical protein